jgi:hypothetical protein
MRTPLGILVVAVLLAWLCGPLPGAPAQSPPEKELSPAERIGRMKAGDPSVPARIKEAMSDLRAKERALRKSLHEVRRQMRQLKKMGRAHLARRQPPARKARAGGDKLDEILQRLGRIERRLDRLEARGRQDANAKAAEPAPEEK